MSNDTITLKNQMTGKPESIKRYNVEVVDWGINFLVATEIDAFKAAYAHQNNYGVKVEYAKGAQAWMVTVWNKFADDSEMNK